MSPHDEREQLLSKANEIVANAKAENRDLTDDELSEVHGITERIDVIDAAKARGSEIKSVMDRLARPDDNTPDVTGAKSLGDQFAKTALPGWADGQGRRSASSPDFKAANDPFVVGTNGQTQYGPVIQTALRRLTVADLLASGQLSASSLTYWRQGAVVGAPAAVAENAPKPYLNFAWSPVTESLTKIAALTKVSDEAMADTDYIVSVINSQLVVRLQIEEENQLLNGNGTAPNMRGILNRSGIQTHSSTAAANNMDAIFHGVTLVATNALMPADGIVINPTDFEVLRLAKDLNGQYFGGGPFSGPYGQGGITLSPPLWGVPTVVTPAIAAGTVLVGAFQQSAQVFRKGGISVESTNSNTDDFENNRVTLRAEERLLMAVYFAAGFVKVTLSAL